MDPEQYRQEYANKEKKQLRDWERKRSQYRTEIANRRTDDDETPPLSRVPSDAQVPTSLMPSRISLTPVKRSLEKMVELVNQQPQFQVEARTMNVSSPNKRKTRASADDEWKNEPSTSRTRKLRK